MPGSRAFSGDVRRASFSARREIKMLLLSSAERPSKASDKPILNAPKMFTALHVACGLEVLTLGLDQLGRRACLHVQHWN
jgi:hypothetical protein